MCSLPLVTWIRFFVWLAIGLLVYFFYGKDHSALARSPDPSPAPDGG